MALNDFKTKQKPAAEKNVSELTLGHQAAIWPMLLLNCRKMLCMPKRCGIISLFSPWTRLVGSIHNDYHQACYLKACYRATKACLPFHAQPDCTLELCEHVRTALLSSSAGSFVSSSQLFVVMAVPEPRCQRLLYLNSSIWICGFLD